MIVALLMPLLALGPGYWLVRRLRLRPTDRAAAAVAAGLLVIFAAVFGLFAVGVGPRWYVGVTVGCVAALAAAGRSLAALLCSRNVRALLLGWLAVVAASVLFVLPLRHISGGRWALDWLEHYQRTQYFLHQLPNDFHYIDLYLLPARPPLQNVLMAWAAAHDHPGGGVVAYFGTFQVACAVLGSLVYLPCALLAGRFVPRRMRVRRGVLFTVIACAFILAPNYVAHDLFPWTKLLATFYVVLGLQIYLRYVVFASRPDRRTMICTVAAIQAAGCLVHYSACAYSILIALHFAVGCLRRRKPVELFPPVLAAAAVLFIWVGWSATTFGLRTTFSSNTTVRDSVLMTWSDNIEKLWTNSLRTFVPHPFLISYEQFLFGIPGSLQYKIGSAQNSTLGLVRDYTHEIYSSVLPLAAGSIGGVLLVVMLCRDLVWRRKDLSERGRAERRFWRIWLVAAFALGILTHGEVGQFGVAHVTLVPLTMLAIAYIPVRILGTPGVVRCLALSGWAFDAAVCVVPNLIAQGRHYDMPPTMQGVADAYARPDGLSVLAIGQYQNQVMHHLTTVGDRLASIQPTLQWAGGAVLAMTWLVLAWTLMRGRIGISRATDPRLTASVAPRT